MEYTSIKAMKAAMAVQIVAKPEKTLRALITIYNAQTADEKSSRAVNTCNGRGFTPTDAGILSGIARHVLAGRKVTDKQMDAVRSRIAKYAGQLVRQSLARGLIRKVGKVYLYGRALEAST